MRSQKTYFSLTLPVSILLGILLPLILGTKEFGTIALIFSSIWWIYKKYLLNTAQLCWADENRFAEGEMV